MKTATITVSVGKWAFERRVDTDRTMGQSECERVEEDLRNAGKTYSIRHDLFD
jgi:hypothetical protein